MIKYQYDEAQQQAIEKALLQMQNNDDGFLSYEWSQGIVLRGDRRFAAFDVIAMEVLDAHSVTGDAVSFDDVPVLIDGKMLLQSPDEGNIGILYLRRITMLKGKPQSGEWYPCYVNTGWLWTKELGLSNEEIRSNIEDEIAQGRNVFSNPPPGWV